MIWFNLHNEKLNDSNIILNKFLVCFIAIYQIKNFIIKKINKCLFNL